MTDTGRVEAFSDGVLAIAITLLVLELKVPTDLGEHTLWAALRAEWPSFAAYVVSFLVIGVMWVNHHALFRNIGAVDRPLLFVNLLLLMGIGALPFPTALLAEYVDKGTSASHTAAAVYGGLCVFIACCFSGLWAYAVAHPRLLAAGVDPVAARRSVPYFGVGIVVYLLTVALAFVSAPLTLAVHGIIAVYYVFDRLAAPSTGLPSVTHAE